MDPVIINTTWCKGCGICVAFCPKEALSLVEEKAVVDQEKCIACGMCELYCPDLAIVVNKPPKKSVKATEEVAS
ncbi:4Fe-4S dicluster domain-containing protein [Pseudodesulfovibrio sp. JC047]|uniref:4Fe-4S binding protein n=1 Tax=Pseudodesulfovibrio sp. JC047 TaxID=2683199 RepID=UPI0013D391F8|nr:4Fe-4S binding protein [Pseudodesulfovibrio sp. JC047]NDV18381.1 4Fe-4S dicluster domain-containing protein [Pseudodesulfovibrio sp. JC047]